MGLKLQGKALCAIGEAFIIVWRDIKLGEGGSEIAL